MNKYKRTRGLVTDGSFVAQRESRTVLFGSRIINYSQEETLGNSLSRLEEDKSESRVGHATFLTFFAGHPGLPCD